MSEGSKVREAIAAANDIENTNPLGPRNVDAETSKPKLSTQVTASSINPPKKEVKIERKAAPTKETVHMDICLPFIRTKLVDTTVPIPSSYVPSSHMLYFMLHNMDNLMIQNHDFIRNNTQYHPLVTRIYYGTLFYIQILRCMNHVKMLDRQTTEFLKNFLETYPPESLSIAGPLAVLFQSITCSTSRFAYQGKIYPSISDPDSMIEVTNAESEFIYSYPLENTLLPNMYLLHGMIGSLTSLPIKALTSTPDFPRVWNPFLPLPVPGNPAERIIPLFNSVQPADLSAWTVQQRWTLANPATAYPNEATREQNEKFAQYGDRLDIPDITITDRTLDIEEFLNLEQLAWFGNVMAIATSHAKYFKKSTTLDKCSVEGPGTGQILIDYMRPRTSLVPPSIPGDKRSIFPLVYKASSCNPDLTETEQLMAFSSHLNVRMFKQHPAQGHVNLENGTRLMEGPFWDIRPIAMEASQDTGCYQLKDVILDHFYQDKPKF